MRATIPGLILLFIVAACGQASGQTPATASPAAPSIAVLQTTDPSGLGRWDTIAIARLDGRVMAKATFAPMPVPSLGCMGAVIPQSAHVAGGKVFYADAKGVVRTLSLDGTIATATTFPLTSTQQMLSFAASPDGTQILGTVYTTPKNAFSCDGAAAGAPFSFDAYSATNGGSSTLVYHQDWTSVRDVLALTGWDAVGPIGTYPTVWASQGGGPGSTLGVFVRVDATTLKPGAPLSDPNSCRVWDSVATGTFVCTQNPVSANQKTSQPVSIRRADGTEAWRFTVTTTNPASSPALSPDGEHVTMCCADVSSGFSYLLIGHDGTQGHLANGFYASAWLDSATMVGDFNTDPLARPPFPLAYVVASAPDKPVSIGLSGKVVGIIRG